MKEPYTLKEILASMTPEKRRADGTMTRFLFRPLSYPVSLAALNLGISPNAVTYFSALCCLLALVFALTWDFRLHLAAAGLFLLFGILDCADGNMARTLARRTGAKNPYGAPVDAAGGYIAYAAQLLAFGLSIYRLDVSGLSAVPGAEWLVIAALASLANILMRLIHQAFKNAELAAGIAVKPGREKRFSEEIGVTGYMPVLYLAGLLLPSVSAPLSMLLPAALLVYALIYCGGFCITLLKLARKASAATRGGQARAEHGEPKEK